MWQKFYKIILSVCFVMIFSITCKADDIPTVAGASDLQFALKEIANNFEKDLSLKINLAFGSSGNFYRQLMQDAPFEIFLSADEDFVFKLNDVGKTLNDGDLYAIGRIVLFATKESYCDAAKGFAGLKEALDNGNIVNFAIANPEHAPYGRAAKEALISQNLWETIEPKLVLGENISQTTQFITTNAVQCGISAYSLVLAPNVGKLGNYKLLPSECHNPLKQRMVLTKNAGETAKKFYDYLKQPKARHILEQYGFVLP